MRIFINLIKTIPFLLLLIFAVTGTAHAYLDPTTGSYILQILMAFSLAVLFSIKLFWNKIKSFFKKFMHKNKDFNDK